MASYNYSFGETILAVLQKERDRKQEQEKLAQSMAFENRQLDLMNVFRNKQLEQDQSQFDASLGFKQQSLQQDEEQFESKKGLDLLKLDEDTRQFDESLKFKKDQLSKELGLGYARLNKEDKPSPYGDTPLDFTKINNMIWKDYYKLPDEDSKLTWREKAGEEVTGLLKTTGIGQSVVDEIWNIAQIEDKDTPKIKREKLKNVISQLNGQLNNSQIQTLYRMAEVRTR